MSFYSQSKGVSFETTTVGAKEISRAGCSRLDASGALCGVPGLHAFAILSQRCTHGCGSFDIDAGSRSL